MKDMNFRPCPFCGGETVPVYSDNGSLYTSNILVLSKRGTVKCKKCEVRLSRIYSRVSKAIEVWNKRAEPHWIPCKERMPDKDGAYIVSGKWKDGEISVGECYYSTEDRYFNPSWRFTVLAWMEKPEPYQEGE